MRVAAAEANLQARFAAIQDQIYVDPASIEATELAMQEVSNATKDAMDKCSGTGAAAAIVTGATVFLGTVGEFLSGLMSEPIPVPL
jgi:hypothetical protein